MTIVDSKIIGVAILLLILVLILIYFWLIRGRLLEKNFIKYFPSDAIFNNEDIPVISSGKILKSIKIKGMTFRLFRIYHSAVHRFLWYLVVDIQKSDHSKPDGIYGKGILPDLIESPYIELQRQKSDCFNSESIPKNWEALCVKGDQYLLFYPLPELFGSGNLKLIEKFLEMDSELDKGD